MKDILLKLGSKGYKVKLLQYALKIKGYDIVIDGDFGPKTEFCVVEVQEKNNLIVNGIVDDAFYNLIRAK